ncbi:MAG: N-acetyltransferase [Melioribacteraceae bacterium]|nr:N-acetyltransferase [Melioribacteraceae bacterium]
MEKKIEIRKYQFSDLESLYNICLLTGDSGNDASHLYNNAKLLGDFYAAPYAILEPELTFIVTVDNEPTGYILGTRNSEDFANRCELEWFPILREKYKLPKQNDSSPDANIIRLIHSGYKVKEELINYPAHLHIDLLPITQGMGIGRKLITTFTDELKSMKVNALHLEVGRENEGAIAFYKKVGFHIIKEYEFSIAFGMHLE